MNVNEIDELFASFRNKDYKELFILLDIGYDELDNLDLKNLTINEIETVLKVAMKEIEKGDFEYFYNQYVKAGDNATNEIVYRLLVYSTKKDIIKEYLRDEKKTANLTDGELTLLISKTKDSEFIKGIINKKEENPRLMSLVENEAYLTSLIISTRDKEYIKDLIEDNEKRKEIYKDSCYDCLQICDLIIGTKDSEYIKSIIENETKRKYLGIHDWEISKMIIETKDTDYIKHKIYNPIGRDSLYFTNLIKATKDLDFIKSLIENKSELQRMRLGKEEVIDIIISTKDSEFIKGIIEDKTKSKKYNFKGEEVVRVILSLDDPEYVKDIVNSKEKIKQLNIDSEGLVELITDLGECGYAKEIIENKELLKKLNLSKSDLIKLIIQINDDDYLEKIIENNKKSSQFKFSESELNQIAIYLTDSKYIDNRLKRFENDKKFISKNSFVKLPKNMTIGIEIESEGKNSELIEADSMFYPGWICKHDGSLKNGVEVVSPVLKGDDINTTNQIQNVCRRLSRLGQNVSERCGGHIHIGADYLTSQKSWQNLIEIWSNSEKVIYTISNKEGEIPRTGVGEYAAPISSAIEELLDYGSVELNDIEDLRDFVKKAQPNVRYQGINFRNLGTKMNTIEFRLANGTIDENTWIENINLFGGIVKAAEDLANIQEKNEDERSNEEIAKLQSFENLRNSKLNDKQKVNSLLELAVSTEDRNIYQKRFNINSLLIAINPKIKKSITEKVAKSNVSINKIGKKVFIGDEGLTGQDYIKNEGIIQAELRRQMSKNNQANYIDEK